MHKRLSIVTLSNALALAISQGEASGQQWVCESDPGSFPSTQHVSLEVSRSPASGLILTRTNPKNGLSKSARVTHYQRQEYPEVNAYGHQVNIELPALIEARGLGQISRGDPYSSLYDYTTGNINFKCIMTRDWEDGPPPSYLGN
jgi:hypothetical protein